MPESFWPLMILPAIFLGGILLWPHWWARKCHAFSQQPLTDKQRPAGWSLQEKTQDLLFEALFEAALLTTLGISLCYSGALKTPFSPVILLSLCGCVFFALRFRGKIVAFANHSLGLQGEQLVGSTLDRLSSESIHIFHDIEISLPGQKSWNIDHVALTPAGLFVFETRARRKPMLMNCGQAADCKVVFNGDELRFPNCLTDCQAPRQACRNAEWLAWKLSLSNATKIPVSSAIVIPGWWIDRTGRGSVCVLNEKQIKSYISTSPATLSKQLFNAISNQLNELSKLSFA